MSNTGYCEMKTNLVMSAAETTTFKGPGILILIAGDRDYKPLIDRALDLNWTVETWFWNLGMKMSVRNPCELLTCLT